MRILIRCVSLISWLIATSVDISSRYFPNLYRVAQHSSLRLFSEWALVVLVEAIFGRSLRQSSEGRLCVEIYNPEYLQRFAVACSGAPERLERLEPSPL